VRKYVKVTSVRRQHHNRIKANKNYVWILGRQWLSEQCKHSSWTLTIIYWKKVVGNSSELRVRTYIIPWRWHCRRQWGNCNSRWRADSHAGLFKTLLTLLNFFWKRSLMVLRKDLRFSWWCLWIMASSGMLRHVALVRTDVSEELSASIIRVTRIGELRTMFAIASNRRTLQRNIFLSPWLWRR
jgi:hypothetical protein